MKDTLMVSESTLTDRYQTTVPNAVRKALNLSKREKIRYTIQSDGNVLLSRASHDETDPALGNFLAFLAKDIQQNPQRLQAITSDLVVRIQDLVDGVEIDLNTSLDDEDD